MKKLFALIIALMLCCMPSYAQIWEGSGGSGIDEGLGFGNGSGGSGFDWSDFTGEKCTITFQSIDGTYSQSAVVPVGVPSSYVMPAISVPNKTGYDIDGWSYLSNYPTQITIPENFIATQTYYVIYTPHTHDVTFMIDNTVYHVEQDVPYGTAIPLPTDPTYPDIPQNDCLYEWSGLPSTMPDNDVTVSAVYGIAYWGMDINQSTGEITYLYRAQNMLPIRVSYISDTQCTISNWSDSATSWKSFVYDVAKPCMLKSNGTVDYYLNRDDQRYKEDGITASDYNNTSYDGNAMVEFKKMYIKITEPETNIIRVLFSEVKIDNTFTAYAFTDENGNEKDNVFYGMFVGVSDGTKLRSIVGGSSSTFQPNTLEAKAELNGTGWNIEYYSLRNYINLLTVLVTKTLNVSVSAFNAPKASGTSVSSNETWGTNQGAFAVGNTNSNTTYRFKLFWIRDYFINEHLTRGISYDATNTCWKYRNIPPYSYTDLTSYLSCPSNNLTFYVDRQGYNYALIDKMAVLDNLLFPYQEYVITSSDSGSSVTSYGNSFVGNLIGTTINTSSGIYPYVCFGAHNLVAKWVTATNNIWSVQIGNSVQSSWTNGVIRTSLIYMPQSQ